MANNQELLDDSNLEVPRGFLISLDDKGNYVPFLIKVRDKEIIWSAKDDENEVYQKLQEYMETTGIKDGDGMISVPTIGFKSPNEKLVITMSTGPNGSYIYERFEIEPDGHFKGLIRVDNMYTRFNKKSTGSLFGKTCEIVRGEFPLPFKCDINTMSLAANTFDKVKPSLISFARAFPENPMNPTTYTRKIIGEIYTCDANIGTESHDLTQEKTYTFSIMMDGYLVFTQ